MVDGLGLDDGMHRAAHLQPQSGKGLASDPGHHKIRAAPDLDVREGPGIRSQRCHPGGENAFDGTPLNPAAPDRVPGGSSSGSVSAVAQSYCDFALGTDTGGSVRVPASFCGLYGIRPTHGRLPLDGMLPQAPSSDTTGWFARDAATFARVASVLLDEKIPSRHPARLVVAVDALGFADTAVRAALRVAASRRWSCELLDLRTSADTAGPRDRVVGYGAFALGPGTATQS